MQSSFSTIPANKFTKNIHNHGIIKLIDVMPGSTNADKAIVDAARTSFGGNATKTLAEDISLINYLMEHRHTSPFEMVEFKFYLKMPIFVARQWHRHRTASINEVSGRYVKLSEEYYIPDTVRAQSTDNKQGSSGDAVNKDVENIYYDYLNNVENIHSVYPHLIEHGVAKELARIALPLSTYTEFYWKIDLHNLLHFLKLRLDTHAQKEIRDYAEIIYKMIKKICPEACKAFEKHVLNAATLNSSEINAIATGNYSALSKREKTKMINLGLMKG